MAPIVQRSILLLILFIGNTVAGQVRLIATVSPPQIAKDESIQLRLTVENATEVDQIIPPPLNDFTIVGGPSQESSTSIINGITRSAVSLVYFIKPKGPGNFSIPSATAIVAGNRYRSASVSVQVSNTISGNKNNSTNSPMSLFNMADPFDEESPHIPYNEYVLKKGENAADKIKNNMLVRVEVNKDACFVGEPVIATYKLYTRLKSESGVTQNPSFNGFSVIDMPLPGNMGYTNERYNGKDYNVYVIRKVQLYPLQAGNLELGSVEVENKVQFIKAAYARQQQNATDGPFADLGGTAVPTEGIVDQMVTLQSKPLSILVKPLPEAGRPQGFKGVVGNFTLAGTLEKNSFSTDDAGKLQLTLSGEGNMQLVNSPEIKWPSALDAFEPKITDDITKTTVPTSGIRSIEYPFTASKPGRYRIPAVECGFFDPQRGTYKIVSTQPFEFTVTQGTGRVAKDTLALVNKQNNTRSLQKFFNNRRLVASIVAVLILTGLIIYLKKDNKRIKQEKEKAAKKEKEAATSAGEPIEEIINNQKNPLEDVEQHLLNGNSKDFYTSLDRSFRHFLAQRLTIPPEELNKKTINEQMDKQNIPIETAIQVQQLLDEVEWELYTPFADNSKMQQVYGDVNDVIQLLRTYKVQGSKNL